MQLRNTTSSYGALAKILHWSMGIIFIGLIPLGLWMSGLESSDLKWTVYGLHKSLGITILGLVALRIGWRLINTTPRMPVDSASWEIRAAKLTHLSLYVLMLAMPLSGWVMSSAGGHAVTFFSLFGLPEIVEKNPDLGKLAWNAHGYLGYVAIGFISLHILAALYHHLFKRDDILTRMLPSKKP